MVLVFRKETVQNRGPLRALLPVSEVGPARRGRRGAGAGRGLGLRAVRLAAAGLLFLKFNPAARVRPVSSRITRLVVTRLLLRLRVQAPVRGRAVLPVVLDVDEPVTKDELAVDVLAVVENSSKFPVREDELALACVAIDQ